MVIDYDPDRYATGFGFVRIVTSFHGTVLPHVLRSGLFYTILALHGILQILEQTLFQAPAAAGAQQNGNASSASGLSAAGSFEISTGSSSGLPRVSWELSTVSLTLCIFFLVFYTNSQHLRFMEFYNHVVGINGSTMVWAGLVRMNLTRVGKADWGEHRPWNAVRYFVAASQVFYYDINDSGDSMVDAVGVDDYEWQEIVERGLLGAREGRWLEKYAGFKPWQCLTWAIDEVFAQIELLPPSASEPLRKELLRQEFRQLAIQMRYHMGQINELRRMQVPFPYFHMINLILLCNLVLVAYAAVPLAWWPFSFFIVGLLSIFLIGMRSIALKLSNPFGTNKLDFDLEMLMKGVYDEAVAQLTMRERPPSLDTLPEGMRAGEVLHNPTLVVSPTSATPDSAANSAAKKSTKWSPQLLRDSSGSEWHSVRRSRKDNEFSSIKRQATGFLPSMADRRPSAVAALVEAAKVAAAQENAPAANSRSSTDVEAVAVSEAAEGDGGAGSSAPPTEAVVLSVHPPSTTG